MPKARADVEHDLRHSVVKLFTVIKEPNYYQPWDYGYQTSSGGSGCILPGKRILTNAHVVSNAVYVQVLKPGDTKRYTATVLAVDHSSETALLEVSDPTFFDGTKPVKFGELPHQRDQVAAYGFPIGGNELSITEGVVSRIEVLTYTHSQRELLALQIDAAINPGNSGGPVFKDGKLVGIAFQSYAGSNIEKSGYVVPLPVIRHFLADIERGVPPVVPDLGVYWQRVDNDDLRDYLGMKPDQTGVLVTRVVSESSADGVLEEEDVITRVDGTNVGADGSIALREHDRVNFTHLISQRHVGERVEVEFLRKRRVRTRKVRLAPLSTLVPRPRYGVRPSYVVFAGLVFTPLSYNYMKVWDWKDVEPRFRYLYVDGLPTPARREVVLLSQVLAHDINVGYHRLLNAVVDRINGVAITQMRDVVRALARPSGKFHVIELDNHAGERSSDYHAAFGTRLVFRASLAEAATREILERYDISAARSADLDEPPPAAAPPAARKAAAPAVKKARRARKASPARARPSRTSRARARRRATRRSRP